VALEEVVHAKVRLLGVVVLQHFSVIFSKQKLNAQTIF
jgi:hypothetical protein